MLDFLYSIFPSLNEGEKIVPRKESTNLKLPSAPLKVKKRVSFESSPLLQKYEKDEKKSTGIIRVKILMRKEAADELISKCKDGGKLEFDDVSQYLKEIPGNASVCVLALNNKDE